MVEVRSNCKKFYFWWFGNPVCGESTGSKRHFVSVWLPYQHFGQTFFRVYGACSANHFLTSIFTHTKLHQHVGLILINSLANMLAQFVPVNKFMNKKRFYHWFLVRYFSKWLIFELINKSFHKNRSLVFMIRSIKSLPQPDLNQYHLRVNFPFSVPFNQ